MAKSIQNMKFVPIAGPVAIVSGGSFTTASFDTYGFNRCDIIIRIGASDSTTNCFSAMKLQTSDVDSGYTDITGKDFSVAAYGTLPLSASDDNTTWTISVNRPEMKRFLDLTLTVGSGGSGTYAYAFAMLSEPDVAPLTDAGRGVTGQSI